MKKRIGVLLLCMLLAVQAVLPAYAAGDRETILALGSDLSAEQRKTVLDLIGISESDLSSYQVIYTTNEQEHQYLDAYLPASVIGTRSLSSVLVIPADEGQGLSVTTYNINYCTESMYRNALLTAGLADANVIVAAPTPISGTAALIGAVKAYEVMSGEAVSEASLETATNELVVTGELSELLEDPEKASEIIAYVKQQMLENGIESPEDIEALIRDAAEKFDISLSEENIAKIRDLMGKISDLDIDVDALAKQAGDLYEKLKELGGSVDKEQLGNFLTRIFEAAAGLLEKLFGTE